MKSVKSKTIIYLFYIVYTIIFLFVITLYGMGSEEAKLRYYALFVLTSIGIVFLGFTTKFRIFKNTKYGKKSFLIVFVGIIFLLVSMYKANLANYPLDMRTIVQVSFILLPPINAFVLSNMLSTKNIIKLFRVMLFITIIAYFTESDHFITQFLTMSIYTTESSVCGEVFFQLFLFFYYFRYFEIDGIQNRDNKFFAIISAFFTILSQKRLATLCIILVPIIGRIIDYKKEVSEKIPIITSVVMVIITYFYFQFMRGELFPNLDVFRITTGRDYILSLWERIDFFSYGYGTSMLLIGRYLEMDLIQIFVEMGTISLLIFSYSYFKITKKSIYSYMIMCIFFGNLLTASSLQMPLPTYLMLTTVIIVSERKYEKEGVLVNSRNEVKK